MNFSIPTFQTKLLQWYDQFKRDLPWRNTTDPYAIWLSEIMLQQTTVETVKNGYYHQFLKKFPNLKKLAQSDINDLLHAWSGLGYYNRIRNFQKAAQIIVNDLNEKIPNQFKELIKLPGLGDYTARAVASIAFNEKTAVVDGNVMRVLARLFCYGEDIQSSEAKRFFQTNANQLIDEKRPGDFNQAMMEIGACICLPKNPQCLVCPLNSFCQSYQTGTHDLFPVKNKKIIYQNKYLLSFIFENNSKVFLKKITGSVNKDLWEFPSIEINSIDEIESKLEEKNYKNYRFIKPFQHAIMNQRLKIHPVIIPYHKLNTNSEKKWILKSKINDIALSTISKKILKNIA